MGHCAKQHMGHPLSGRATQITVLHAKKAFLFKLVSWSHLTSHISLTLTQQVRAQLQSVHTFVTAK